VRRYRTRSVLDGSAPPTICAVQDARETTRYRDLTLAEFVDRLASPDPIPGGGSAAAVAASLGAALVAMVASLSIGRERYAQHAANLAETAVTGRHLAARLLELAEDDALAYGRYAAALKRPKDTDAHREARALEIAGAARRAAEVPLETLRACLDVAVAAERIAGRSNVNAASDLAVAALLANAAAQAAGANVIVNLPAIEDLDWTEETARTVVELQNAVEDVAQMTRETVGSRTARGPVEPRTSPAAEAEG
jgi:formiminotetrahydrofolate cyclodeaminase